MESIPASNLIIAGHGTQSFNLQDGIPGLVVCIQIHGDRAFACFQLCSQEPLAALGEEWVMLFAVLILCLVLVVWLCRVGEMGLVATGRGGNVLVERDVRLDADALTILRRFWDAPSPAQSS
ncbi:hypothetical protein HPB49_007155 [Dermacentor silvarum]|uniref:Uncharacterized protein n=1 Tax=Dermacentor silvarum TaxID=543639 RepID=A0ACB8C7W4_DERSI|nr:hypothetical protein HPB49_007155 [Dermacentor silvarum]